MAAFMVVSQAVYGRVIRNLEWTDQARGTAAPRSPSRNGSAGFFPLPPNGGIPREAKKPAATVLRCAAGLAAAGRSLPGPRTAIEAAIGAARQQTETVCRDRLTITADKIEIDEARERGRQGRLLPVWQGLRQLSIILVAQVDRGGLFDGGREKS